MTCAEADEKTFDEMQTALVLEMVRTLRRVLEGRQINPRGSFRHEYAFGCVRQVFDPAAEPE